MPLSLFRLGLFAWSGRRGLGRAALVLGAAVLGVPLVVALALVAAVAAPGSSPAPATSSIVRPLPGWIVTQPYGCTGLPMEPSRGSCAHFHFGIDLAAPAGTPVVASLPGQAEVFMPEGAGGGYGLHVVVRHSDGLETLYAHLQDVAIESGQEVSAGATLGHEGSSGLSTGPHLHFEVRAAGVAVDPVSTLPGIFGPDGQPR